ncbi:hypothetical protein HRG_013423 [Hirsutella rhossiliensis]
MIPRGITVRCLHEQGRSEVRRDESLGRNAASSSRLDGIPPAPAPAPPPSLLDSIVASTSDPPARPLRYRMQK